MRLKIEECSECKIPMLYRQSTGYYICPNRDTGCPHGEAHAEEAFEDDELFFTFTYEIEKRPKRQASDPVFGSWKLRKAYKMARYEDDSWIPEDVFREFKKLPYPRALVIWRITGGAELSRLHFNPELQLVGLKWDQIGHRQLLDEDNINPVTLSAARDIYGLWSIIELYVKEWANKLVNPEIKKSRKIRDIRPED